MYARIAVALCLSLTALLMPNLVSAQVVGNEPAINLLIDVSGSMSGPRLDSAIEAVQESARALPDSTAIGLRSYAGSCDQDNVAPLVPIGVGNNDEVVEAAEALVAGGGTPTTEALDRGIDELASYSTTGDKRLVLLTDGDTQCGISICDFVRQKLPDNITLTINAVGLQVSPNAESDLTCAATHTGGSYVAVDDLSDLIAALGEAAGARKTCALEVDGGWKFRAHVSDNDGLVLDHSSFQGRKFTESVSVPYLDGLYSLQYRDKYPHQMLLDPYNRGIKKSHAQVARIELTPKPSLAHSGVVGSRLVDWECVRSHPADSSKPVDIYVKVVYRVDDFLDLTYDFPSSARPLEVTQKYLFRDIDEAHRCEPTNEFSLCGRFWPSVEYDASGLQGERCITVPSEGSCKYFAGIRTVQRIHFAPDGIDHGAINAFRDLYAPEGFLARSGVKTLGKDDAMKYEAIGNAIHNGKRGAWDSIHQSPTDATSGPGINLWNLTPGCGECVHMHWAWGTATNIGEFREALGVFKRDFTDGRPMIRDGSTQRADFGIVRNGEAEEDPYRLGWRSLVNAEGSDASKLAGHVPLVYWEMTSSGESDAAFPILDNYDHGGNGAIFFGGHHDDGVASH